MSSLSKVPGTVNPLSALPPCRNKHTLAIQICGCLNCHSSATLIHRNHHTLHPPIRHFDLPQSPRLPRSSFSIQTPRIFRRDCRERRKEPRIVVSPFYRLCGLRNVHGFALALRLRHLNICFAAIGCLTRERGRAWARSHGTRCHVAVSGLLLLAGSRSIDLDEQRRIGPSNKIGLLVLQRPLRLLISPIAAALDGATANSPPLAVTTALLSSSHDTAVASCISEDSVAHQPPVQHERALRRSLVSWSPNRLIATPRRKQLSPVQCQCSLQRLVLLRRFHNSTRCFLGRTA